MSALVVISQSAQVQSSAAVGTSEFDIIVTYSINDRELFVRPLK